MTFAPVLMSSQVLRENAKSNNYGVAVPKSTKSQLEVTDLRPWEEVPTFTPATPVCALRDSAKSTGYGVAVPIKKIPEFIVPSFKPVSFIFRFCFRSLYTL